MTDLETEILFLRQTVLARKIASELPTQQAEEFSYMPVAPVTPDNGHRGTLRQVGIASCPLAPESKITTRGRVSREGIVNRQIAQNNAEIARLKALIAAESSAS